MTTSNEGYGAEKEKKPQPAAGSQGKPLSSDDLTAVKSTTGMITFTSTGSSVNVSVTVPENTPALENLTLYGASNNSNPSSSESNKLEHQATRNSTTGTIARNNNSCTSGERYTIQLKFWYHGENQTTDPATILTGSSLTTNTNVALS